MHSRPCVPVILPWSIYLLCVPSITEMLIQSGGKVDPPVAYFLQQTKAVSCRDFACILGQHD